ncbi:MAG: cytochrome c [Chlorobiaceae bacterium]|nr:cytochrome c [Chlorobiaceae bacterium]
MKTKVSISKFALFAAIPALMLAGCGKPQGKAGKVIAKGGSADSLAAAEANANLPFDVKEGKRLFSHYCSVCHGETGDGTGQYYGSSLQPSPANFTDKAFMKNMTDESLTKSITGGSASVGKSNMCPPWGKTFESDEIECLVAYVKTFSK